ncbi:MAG: multicopper oxidase family protein [Gammaproteobacteria bacterium]
MDKSWLSALIVCGGLSLRLAAADSLTAQTMPAVRLADGARFELIAAPTEAQLNSQAITLWTYNQALPGPLLRVKQGSRVNVSFVNHLEQATTVHWHGLRQDYHFDGVPGISQQPVAPGGRFDYELAFPDAGLFWYHPHIREDLQQDLGLYGAILVEPNDSAAWGRFDRDAVVILDDLLTAEDRLVPHDPRHADHALMGRFGNTFLVNGSTAARFALRAGEVMRLYFLNVANTRTFRISIPGLKLKRVGADLGRFEREEWLDDFVLAPGERLIVDAHFAEAGVYPLRHRGDANAAVDLARFEVGAGATASVASTARENSDLSTDLRSLDRFLDRLPAQTISLRVRRAEGALADPHAGHHMAAIEWEDNMGEANAAATSADTQWILRDEASGKENMDIDYHFRRGEQIKIRLRNPLDGGHPMQHPIHFHGQRFAVLAVDGEPVSNRAWKDTVLVPAGAEVDIVLDASNPGKWMAHCHIAEHLSSGMMLGFEVVN